MAENTSNTEKAAPVPARTAGDLNNTVPGDNSQPGVPVKDVANKIAEPPEIDIESLPADHPERESLATIKLERDLMALSEEDRAGSGDEVGGFEAKENREAALAEDGDQDAQKIKIVEERPTFGGTPDSGEPGTADGDDTPGVKDSKR